jgi:thiol-disulfide isomerase/thioredoxin
MEKEPNKTGNKKVKARAAAGWEWFKQAAWLQVLLIVGVVVGVIIAIPSIVSAVRNSSSGDRSTFYKGRNISYATLRDDYLAGKSPDKTDGLVGEGNIEYTKSEDKTGFVVMFYKDNCEVCKTMQKHVETFFSNFNKKYEKNALKFFTINVGWEPNDETKSTNQEGKNPEDNYHNKDITLDEQYEVQQYVKARYMEEKTAPGTVYDNAAVNEETLDARLNIESGGGTLPTPCFCLYTKLKTETSYDIANPTKVVFGMEGSLSQSSSSDVNKQMFDLYNLALYTENK